MDTEIQKLGRANAAFALSAAITVLFNTVIACAKDASAGLKTFMASLSGNDWTTQGIADLILFLLLGFIFLRTSAPENIGSSPLVSFLVAAVVIAGVGLFTWYALY